MKNKVLRLMLPGLLAVVSIGCHGMDVGPLLFLTTQVSNQTNNIIIITTEGQQEKPVKIASYEDKTVSFPPSKVSTIETNCGWYQVKVVDNRTSTELRVQKLFSKEKAIVIPNAKNPIIIFEEGQAMPTITEATK